ncbi:hypothetical protein P7K49_008576 [Saguinus oedipus]|uniref:Uncharacterized protein n=1 Tax=Saguinus oedipus TaxID=9490 RepID=A0ABQ9VYN6_SAGOE|nr:hypothetical protein P7K49_008576 [Saguinus oedipus]
MEVEDLTSQKQGLTERFISSVAGRLCSHTEFAPGSPGPLQYINYSDQGRHHVDISKKLHQNQAGLDSKVPVGSQNDFVDVENERSNCGATAVAGANVTTGQFNHSGLTVHMTKLARFLLQGHVKVKILDIKSLKCSCSKPEQYALENVVAFVNAMNIGKDEKPSLLMSLIPQSKRNAPIV